MKFDDVGLLVVASPLLAMFALSFIIRIPLTNQQILYIGLPLFAVALVFSWSASKITRVVVARHGPDRESNPFGRSSLRRGTYGRDRRRLLMIILVLIGLLYFVDPNRWLFLVAGGFGEMSLDWMNDFLVLRKETRPDVRQDTA